MVGGVARVLNRGHNQPRHITLVPAAGRAAQPTRTRPQLLASRKRTTAALSSDTLSPNSTTGSGPPHPRRVGRVASDGSSACRFTETRGRFPQFIVSSRRAAHPRWYPTPQQSTETTLQLAIESGAARGAVVGEPASMSPLNRQVGDCLRVSRKLAFKLESGGRMLPQLIANLEVAGATMPTS
jgi:hypothetical protein